MDQRIFGNHLRTLRKNQRLTQSRLAERAHVSLRSIGNWESGQVVPHEHELRAILNALAVPLAEQASLLLRLSPQQSVRLLRGHSVMQSEIAEIPLCGPGDLLTALRARQGISREQMAARLQVSPSTLSRWENNHYAISEDALAQIETLLPVSKAEMKALRNQLPLASSELEFDPSRPYDHERTMQWAAQFRKERFLRGNETSDLTAFALRQRLWRLSTIHPQARFAFARVSLDYGSWLYVRERTTEAAFQAQQVLRIYERSPTQPGMDLDLPGVLNLLSACAFGSSQRGGDAALQFLRPWLPQVESLSAQVILFSDASLYAAKTGNTEMANRYFRRASDVLAKNAQRRGPEATAIEESLFWYLRLTQARVLLQIGKPWEAFQTIQGSVPLPETRMQNAAIPAMIFYTQIAFAAGERGWTEQWLRRVYEQLAVAEFPRIRKQADEIARQL